MATNTETKTPPTSTPNFNNFDPMAMFQQGQQAFAKMMTDSLARWQAFADQCAAIEQQVASHAQQTVTSWAQLAKDAIAYGQQLSAEGRKLAADAAKKMGQAGA